MSAQAMIRSEELICCGSAPQRPISIPPLTPQLPYTVRRHDRKRLPLPSSSFFLTFSFLLRQSSLPPHANNELYKYHCYTHSQLSRSSPIGLSKVPCQYGIIVSRKKLPFSPPSTAECEVFLLWLCGDCWLTPGTISSDRGWTCGRLKNTCQAHWHWGPVRGSWGLVLFLPLNETALMIGVPRRRSDIDREEITRLVPHWVWEYG